MNKSIIATAIADSSRIAVEIKHVVENINDYIVKLGTEGVEKTTFEATSATLATAIQKVVSAVAGAGLASALYAMGAYAVGELTALSGAAAISKILTFIGGSTLGGIGLLVIVGIGGVAIAEWAWKKLAAAERYQLINRLEAVSTELAECGNLITDLVNAEIDDRAAGNILLGLNSNYYRILELFGVSDEDIRSNDDVTTRLDKELLRIKGVARLAKDANAALYANSRLFKENALMIADLSQFSSDEVNAMVWAVNDDGFADTLADLTDNLDALTDEMAELADRYII